MNRATDSVGKDEQHPIERAAKCFETYKAFAEKLDIHPSMISQMISGIRKVPPDRCIDIETLTHGVVTRYELRPDVFGSPEAVA